MDSIIQFLKEDTLPEERIEVDKVWRKAYLLCIHPEMSRF